MPVIPSLGLAAGVASGGGGWEVQAARVQTVRRPNCFTHRSRSDCFIITS